MPGRHSVVPWSGAGPYGAGLKRRSHQRPTVPLCGWVLRAPRLPSPASALFCFPSFGSDGGTLHESRQAPRIGRRISRTARRTGPSELICRSRGAGDSSLLGHPPHEPRVSVRTRRCTAQTGVAQEPCGPLADPLQAAGSTPPAGCRSSTRATPPRRSARWSRRSPLAGPGWPRRHRSWLRPSTARWGSPSWGGATTRSTRPGRR